MTLKLYADFKTIEIFIFNPVSYLQNNDRTKMYAHMLECRKADSAPSLSQI